MKSLNAHNGATSKFKLAISHLILLEIISMLDAGIRDILINNQNWRNLPQVVFVFSLELSIISMMGIIFYKNVRNAFTIMLMLLIIIRSIYGLYLHFLRINLNVLKTLQIFFSLYIIFDLFFYKDRQDNL